MGLILSVFKWAESRCTRQKVPVTKENMRAVLKDILNQLRYDALSDHNFANIIKKFDVLTHEEVVNVSQTMESTQQTWTQPLTSLNPELYGCD